MVTPELGGVVHPVCLLEDLTRGGRYEIIERPVGGGANRPASVGNISQVGLANPLGSGVLVLPRRVQFDAAIALTINFALEFVSVGLSNGVYLDTRLWPAGGATPGVGVAGIATRVLAAASGFTVFQMPVSATPASNAVEFHPSFVLTPGFVLWVQALTTNNAVQAFFDWAEIPERA
jgi:hypothetical protein